jgi:Kyakuja-Dileera-Zisupton transposase
LVIISQALNIFEDRLGIGYNIGCSFTATIAKSSIAQKAHNNGLCVVVPAFHGYAHKHLCQLSFHPLFIPGFGIEDLKMAECIFASFNGLTNITCYASRFHHIQAIDLFSRQHDDDKHQELCMCFELLLIHFQYTKYPSKATFLLGNYKQIGNMIKELPSVIATFRSRKTPQDTDYHQHLESKRKYLLLCREESSEENFACKYIERLLLHQKAK